MPSEHLDSHTGFAQEAAAAGETAEKRENALFFAVLCAKAPFCHGVL